MKCQAVIKFYFARLHPSVYISLELKEGVLAKCHLNFISLYYFPKSKLDNILTPSKETNLCRSKTECKWFKVTKWEKALKAILKSRFEHLFLLFFFSSASDLECFQPGKTFPVLPSLSLSLSLGFIPLLWLQALCLCYFKEPKSAFMYAVITTTFVIFVDCIPYSFVYKLLFLFLGVSEIFWLGLDLTCPRLLSEKLILASKLFWKKKLMLKPALKFL